MSFTEGLLQGVWAVIAAPIYLIALFFALRATPWRVLGSNRILQHMLFGATVILMILWSMRAGISPGLGIHFLGITVMALVFGWDLAVLAATVALIGMVVIGKESLDGLFINGICSVLLPIAATYAIYWFVEKRLLKNFFVYLFVCGFIGAAVSTAVAGLATSAVLVVDGVYTFEKVYLEYIRYLPLIMFPEGLLNGIFLTGMLVFYPDWVRTFDAKGYIDDQ
ncbi:energy-coupling factor ABC transporter permease [uncultured Neptuniibacter sp.]|uniref:energy-coupling factor ABC transporter permease n=1 Tax=uncultured Neptuniibacter sp. TaxID=502143 RepID=UPI00263603E8|nr:energy-coupling factor ABC transporter permease [uncultured Neptuniibacter sp.]